MTERIPTHDGVLAAADAVAAILPPTPLLPVEIGGVQAWVKAEVLQPIGAFKIRGAWWRLVSLSPEERAAGVVAVSSGNHAQGVAWAARRLGMSATIVMPHDAPEVKLANTKALGAEVVLYQRPGEDRDAVAARLIAQRGGTLVHAFGDPWVIEGQGSAAIEIAAQLGRAPSRIVACCGGGGLAAGLALGAPDSAIHPVEPVGWDMVGQSLAAGAIVPAAPDAPKTICDALQPLATKPINLAVLAGPRAAGRGCHRCRSARGAALRLRQPQAGGRTRRRSGAGSGARWQGAGGRGHGDHAHRRQCRSRGLCGDHRRTATKPVDSVTLPTL